MPWITIFWSLAMRFANDFHSWLRHSWKLLANRLTCDPIIVIQGNSCIILYIFRMRIPTLVRQHPYITMTSYWASQITSLTVVYSTVYSGVDQRKHQSSASLAFVGEFTGARWIPLTKVPGEFPAQKASNAVNVSIWWRHNGIEIEARGCWPWYRNGSQKSFAHFLLIN